MLGAKNCTVTVEIEGDQVLIVLDRKTDCILMPWQDAEHLARAIRGAIAILRDDYDLLDPAALEAEQRQIKLNTCQGKLALIFDHTDRVRYSWRTAGVLEAAIRIKAQELQYEAKEV